MNNEMYTALVNIYNKRYLMLPGLIPECSPNDYDDILVRALKAARRAAKKGISRSTTPYYVSNKWHKLYVMIMDDLEYNDFLTKDDFILGITMFIKKLNSVEHKNKLKAIEDFGNPDIKRNTEEFLKAYKATIQETL